MRIRSPAEYYLKYLVAHPDKLTDADIEDRCLDEGLDFIGKDYIKRLRKKCKPPEPFYPDNGAHVPSITFLSEQRLWDLFQRSVPMKMALEVLEKPRAKEFVETMILTGVPPSAICAYVSHRCGTYCTPEGLALYRHYFWNIDLLDS